MAELFASHVIEKLKLMGGKPKIKYKKGTPYPSHEYIGDCMEYTELVGRGFIVGTHSENISTTYNHRYKGRVLNKEETENIMLQTGILHAEPLKCKPSTRLKARKLANKLPFRNQLKTFYYRLPGKYRII